MTLIDIKNQLIISSLVISTSENSNCSENKDCINSDSVSPPAHWNQQNFCDSSSTMSQLWVFSETSRVRHWAKDSWLEAHWS